MKPIKPRNLDLLEIKCWRAFDASMRLLRGKYRPGALKLWQVGLGLLCVACTLAAWQVFPGQKDAWFFSASQQVSPPAVPQPAAPQRILLLTPAFTLVASRAGDQPAAPAGRSSRFIGAWMVVRSAGSPRLIFLPLQLPSAWASQADGQLLQALRADGLAWDAALSLDERAINRLQRKAGRAGAALSGSAVDEYQQAALFDLTCEYLAASLPGAEPAAACEFPTLPSDWMLQVQPRQAAESSPH